MKITLFRPLCTYRQISITDIAMYTETYTIISIEVSCRTALRPVGPLARQEVLSHQDVFSAL